MPFFRIIILAFLIYWGYKLIKALLSGSGEGRSRVRRRGGRQVAPPPYDPDNVEDIDYRENERRCPPSD